MQDTIVGTCSLCGGAVQVPAVWMGVNPPVPTCARCGAVPVESHGPVIPMQPAPKPRSKQTTLPDLYSFDLNKHRVSRES